MRISQLLGRGDEDCLDEVLRLDELHGIKGQRRTFRDEDDFRHFMEEKGFHCLGEGYYGMVFTHRSFHGRYVLKVFNDAFYEAFIKIAKANADNPHFPRFIGDVMPVTQTARMVRVEVLKPIPHAEIVKLSENFGFMDLKIQAQDVADGEFEIDECEVEPGWEKFFEALVEVYRHKPEGAHSDLHMENVMKRGSTYVITDPYKGAKRFQFGAK